MKMQKGVEKEIRSAIAALYIAVKYITSDKIAGIAHRTQSPNGASYTIQNPKCLETMSGDRPEHVDVFNQFVGTKMCYLYHGLKVLERLVEACEQ